MTDSARAAARNLTSLPALGVLAASLVALPAHANEWTSWRGPHQNGYSPSTGLIDTWSPEGENLIWRQDFIARSTPVVMGGRVYVNGRAGTGVDQQAVVAAFDAETGEPIWENRYNLYLTTVAMNRVGWASLTGDPETGYIYAQLVSGLFLCLDRDGEIVWSRSLKEEHGRFEGYGGRTASAVIDEDQVILNMINGSWGNQGPPRHRYYAFDKRTGAVRWMSTPGGNVYDRNTQSTPVVAVIDGQRLLVGGNADGHIYALQARTGQKVWGFELSKRGINASPVVDDAGRVFISHSEENVDEATLGRVVAIDGTGSGDLTATGELWRWNRNKAGFPSAALHDGRLYIVNNQGNLAAVEAATGEVHWELSIGTVGKASPVWADGKLYVPETNGHFAIVKPGDDSAEILARHEIRMPDGRRYAEFYGSAAIAYGRIYFTTEEGLYCLGDSDAPFEVTASPVPGLGDEGAAGGPPATLLVVPAEVTANPGETHEFQVEAFDARGRALGPVDATWSVRGLDAESAGPRLTIPADSVPFRGRCAGRDQRRSRSRGADPGVSAPALERGLLRRQARPVDRRRPLRHRRGGRREHPDQAGGGTWPAAFAPADRSAQPGRLHHPGRRPALAEGPPQVGRGPDQQRLHPGPARHSPAPADQILVGATPGRELGRFRSRHGPLVHDEAAGRERRRHGHDPWQGLATRHGRARRLDRDRGRPASHPQRLPRPARLLTVGGLLRQRPDHGQLTAGPGRR